MESASLAGSTESACSVFAPPAAGNGQYFPCAVSAGLNGFKPAACALFPDPGTGVKPSARHGARLVIALPTRDNAGAKAKAAAALTTPRRLEMRTARRNIQLFELRRASSLLIKASSTENGTDPPSTYWPLMNMAGVPLTPIFEASRWSFCTCST